jgi:hypothetical protein
MPRSTRTFPTQADKDRYARNIEYYFKVEVPGKIVAMSAADRTKALEMTKNYADTLSAVFLPHDYNATVLAGIPIPAVPAKKK